MFDGEPADLDASATLTAAVEARSAVDRAEVRLLQLAAHWADLHGQLDPADDGCSLPGMEQLVRLGGAGTPSVAEFAPAELGAALGMSPAAADRLIGAALDLRHRLPKLWALTQAGRVRPWIARKAAEATRNLDAGLLLTLDRQLARWALSLGWGRLAALIDAAVIEADPTAAERAARAAELTQGVWLGQSSEHGIKTIHIRTETPNAVWFDASIDRIAEHLATLGDTAAKDVRRARAVGVLAQPQQALNLFNHASSDKPEPSSTAPVPVDTRPPATLYVHLHQQALTDSGAGGGGGGVARLEGAGPITLGQARRWLGHCHVTVKPVLDLADQTSVDAYEIPDRLREAIHLRNPVDIFPFASNTSRRRDIDHTIAYRPPDEGGPPGQTGLHNLGPMTRFHHRIKTHSRWQLRQPFPGLYLWRSPHGRFFLVDHTGTRSAHCAA